jgi:hypothetical protein
MRGNALIVLRHRKRRPHIAMLALVAFLFQAVLISFHAPAHATAAHDLLSDLQIICSATPSNDARSTPIDPASDHGSSSSLSSHCPICRLTQAAATYLPVIGLELVLPEERAAPLRTSLTSVRSGQSRYLPQSPRAPPALG